MAPDMPRILLIAVLVAALAAVLALMLLRPSGDGLDAYPHPFLREATYDPGEVSVLIAPLASPPPPPADLLPAWRCDDPAFADAAGRPWLFPLPRGQVPPQPPRHPGLGMAPDIDRCRPYQTPEGAAQVSAFGARVVK